LALLDLPTAVGLDVDAIHYTMDPDMFGPAIGHMNRSHFWSLQLFERLLHRSSRATVNAGIVNVREDCLQCTRHDVHVLVSSILRCSILYPAAIRRGLKMAQLFIGLARPDGSGTDLTGGTAELGVPTAFQHTPGPAATTLWPDKKFCGALALADTMHSWWSHSTTYLREKPIAAYAAIRSDLIEAFRRIRTYRQAIDPALAQQFGQGGIHIRELRPVVLQYLLVPLHDESQLANPLVNNQNVQ
jgi:hypothetical protein